MHDSHLELQEVALTSTNRASSQSQRLTELTQSNNNQDFNENSQGTSKEYIYTKFLPKPTHLKNELPKKPKSCLKKPTKAGQNVLVKKKSSVSIREDRIPSPINNSSNLSSIIKPKDKKEPTKKTSEKKIQRSISPHISDFVATQLIEKPKKNEKENFISNPKNKIPIYPYSTNSKEQIPKQVHQTNNLEIPKTKIKVPKGLQIEITTSSDEQIGSPSSSMMSQIEQRLLNEEKYGVLYSMYRDKNKEKASALLELYKGTQSAKASSSKNFSLTTNFSKDLQLHNSFRSASPH